MLLHPRLPGAWHALEGVHDSFDAGNQGQVGRLDVLQGCNGGASSLLDYLKRG